MDTRTKYPQPIFNTVYWNITIASIPLLTDFVNNKLLNVLTNAAFAT